MYERLRNIRQERKISVQTLIGILNLNTNSAYYKKESGLINFTVDEAKKLANYFNMSVEELFS